MDVSIDDEQGGCDPERDVSEFLQGRAALFVCGVVIVVLVRVYEKKERHERSMWTVSSSVL